MKEVFIFDLEEGMVVGKDLLTSTGIMIIPAGVMLTRAIIEHLRALGVECVDIDENARRDTEALEAAAIASEQFKKFNKKYVETKDKLNNTFGKILSRNINKSEIEQMVEESWGMLGKNYNSYNMLGMLYSMHSYSDTTYMHCMNVGMIASLIGKWLGWRAEDIKILNACGMFHDIGKLMISKEIIDKPGKLTDGEYRIMKSHTVKGYELLKDMGLDPRIVNSALMHHERCDGSGYPLGVRGDKIDAYSKIVAIADVYEAMTANRVYRGPICPFDVIAQFETEGFQMYETK
ncbi:MAG: HD domain-containing protein, partial [Butyrivibrio sp.]|nr:HD domain-containing protein [Butyrivibrio sp.]